MPPPPPEPSRTVLIDGTKEVSDGAAAAAPGDGSGNSPSKEEEEVENATNAAVEATLVADPTAGSYEHEHDEEQAESISV